MNHEEAQSLLGAYALDAVEPDEDEAIRGHLETCPRCRAELAALREVAAALGDTGGGAPPQVWDRIASQIDEPPPPLRLVRAPKEQPRGWARWRTRVLASAAAVAAAAVAFLGWDVSRLDNRIVHLNAAVAKTGIAQAANAAALASDSRDVSLTSPGGSLHATVVLRPGGQAYVVSASLPPLGPTRTYQLWGLVGTHPVSLTLLGRSPAPAAFRVDPRVSALMITAEPAGGTIAPTSPVLVRGDLTAT